MLYINICWNRKQFKDELKPKINTERVREGRDYVIALLSFSVCQKQVALTHMGQHNVKGNNNKVLYKFLLLHIHAVYYYM